MRPRALRRHFRHHEYLFLNISEKEKESPGLPVTLAHILMTQISQSLLIHITLQVGYGGHKIVISHWRSC